MKEIIKDQTFDQERALYNLNNASLKSITFKGLADGESALKEARNVDIVESLFDLRYPLWHVNKFFLKNCEFTINSRAPLWYSSEGFIEDSLINSPKAVRECDDINISHSTICSEEFGWKSKNINLSSLSIESNYLFFDSTDICLNNVNMKGKYSFQYVKNLSISNSYLDTKDAFWHSEDVYVKNSTIKGEYLGWYSKNITLENCKIIGTQPLCYCENINLINCEMIDTDKSFEYSTVKGFVNGEIKSIKNPKMADIVCDSLGELILEESIYESEVNIVERNYIYEKMDS